MRVTFLGHAGLFIQTRAGSVLCDPWFSPAYLGSWFPFPRNDELDRSAFQKPDYLFISHLHQDHLDTAFISAEVSRDARVLLPDFPTDHLRRALADLGFTDFVETRDGEPLDMNGLRVMVNALITPTDGPIGDSGLALDDGTARMFNQNDSRPVDLKDLTDFGPYDAHFLQFSGAIWYPMVYDFPPHVKDSLGRNKRNNQLARATRFAREIGAAHIFPCAGPPCFLDDDLFDFNDLDAEDTNIFPDQMYFLRYLAQHGVSNAHLLLPGTVAELQGGRCELSHPMSDDQIDAIFSDKATYLDSYRQSKKPEIAEIKASWPRDEIDIIAALKEWWEPLLADAELTCAGVNGRVLLEAGDTPVLIDFLDRRVDRWAGEECRYRFRFEAAPIEQCIARGEEDWINALFLSCRFRAYRKGPYNEYVYSFFKSLSVERMQYVEGYYSQLSPVQELWECEGYLVQRRCPHLRGDLTRFGKVEDGILTCQLHGWQFELATGRCLTSDDRRLYSRPIAPEGEPEGPSPRGGGLAGDEVGAPSLAAGKVPD